MDVNELVNKFRFHPTDTQEKKDNHEAVRLWCLDLACLLNKAIPECDEKHAAIDRLQEVMFWANAGIARYPVIEEKDG